MGLLDKMMTNPLAMASLGLLSTPTRSREPLNPIAFAMQGAMGAQRNQQMQTQNEMQAAQFKLQQEAADLERKRRQDIDALIAALPPEQQALARIAPEGFASARTKQMFEPASPLEVSPGATLVDPKTFQPQYTAPAAPEKPPSGIATYRMLHPEDKSLSGFDAWNRENKRSGAMNVNMGAPYKLETGYMFADPNDPSKGVVPIPGGSKDPNTPKPAGAEVQRMNIALGSLSDGLTRYEQALGEFDPRNPQDMTNPAKIAKIKSIIADLRLQQKEAAALGALAGPDMAVLDAILADPVSVTGAFYGRPGLTAQIAEARSSLSRRRTATDEVTGRTPESAPPVRRYNPATGTIE